MILLYSNRHHTLTSDLHTPFRQEANFLYHSHITEPWCRIAIKDDKKYIFLPDRDERQILREGESISRNKVISDNADATIISLSERENTISNFYDGAEVISTNLDLLNYDASQEGKELKKLLLLQDKDIITLDQSYRAIKSDEEIQKIQKAQQITLDAIDFAIQDIKAGMMEYEIAAKLSYYYASKGYTDAFPPIVASGKNACTLHYTANNSKIEDWDMLLIDTGAYVDGYCGDCSRSIVIRDKESSVMLNAMKWSWSISPTMRSLDKLGMTPDILLSLVQSVHDACVAYVKPSITMKELHQYAVSIFEKEFTKHNLQRKKEYFPHGIGHSIGLDVHDPLDKDRPLEKNMVITIEPWIYIPERNIGIRRENIVTITEDGAKMV